jgi:class 3 adenylate cyclase
MRARQYRYNSLEDFLVSNQLTVDGRLNDGWGAVFPIKGREIQATILFADIAGFSRRTLDLSPTETLIFVNNFFAWISAEALPDSNGIVDKYIGDELMIVFSKEFGSQDPFLEAIEAARWMAEHDALSFTPHMGIASGPVIVGYVGTPVKYNCSVFGSPVALAARCAAIRPEMGEDGPMFSSSIVFPAGEWGERVFSSVFPPEKYKDIDGSIKERPHAWDLRSPRKVKPKNLPECEVREIVTCSMHLPSQSAEERARASLDLLRAHGRYWPTGG